jgi:23S rRNA (uridine2552-2'-O)-methyltransferase
LKHIRTAKGRKLSSTRWLERQLNDPYVKKAKAENYRSRAAYKLTELDERFGFLKGVKSVIDLGIAPGGWSQVVRRQVPGASIVGIDLLPTDPIEGVTILHMDFMDHDLVAELKRNFATVKHAKPPASRKGSSEWYVIAQGFKGSGQA